MSLTATEAQKIAHLARLEVNEDNLAQYASQLSAILDFVAQMEAINTDNVQPMAHPIEMSQRLRADEITEHNQHEAFQSIAPKTEAGLYLVPAVIE